MELSESDEFVLLVVVVSVVLVNVLVRLDVLVVLVVEVFVTEVVLVLEVVVLVFVKVVLDDEVDVVVLVDDEVDVVVDVLLVVVEVFVAVELVMLLVVLDVEVVVDVTVAVVDVEVEVNVVVLVVFHVSLLALDSDRSASSDTSSKLLLDAFRVILKEAMDSLDSLSPSEISSTCKSGFEEVVVGTSSVASALWLDSLLSLL